MKTKFLLLMTLVMVAFQGWTAPVDLKKAQIVAQSFANANSGYMAAFGHTGLKLAHAEQSGKFKNQPVYYVFNADDGFIIVSGDDRAEDILAYGDGQFDINNIPCGMRCLLDTYKEQIELLQSNPKMQVEKISQGTPSLMATSVSPLLSTKWGQNSPYNNQCPKYQGKACVTGCVATAMSQIMQYWQYPSTAPAMSAYTTTTNKIYVGALSSKTLSWNQSNDAKAWLMRYAGQSVRMDYGTNSSSAQSDPNAKNAFVNQFKYSSSATFKYKDGFSDTQWNSMLKTELNAGRPVYYRASHKNSDGTYSGHAFIIDGYNTAGKYHINWGWDGSYSGSSTYFALNAFNPGSSKFNYGQAMITDLRPMTILSINPNPVAFNSKTVGKTYTASISIKGYHLTGNLSLKLSGSSMFSINKTTISKSAATGSTTVTVTYKPTSAGTHNATITISGGGLTTNKTISLKGTAVKRVITVTPEIVSFFKVPKGTTVKKTFKVTATNLTGPLSVSLTDATGMFSINKSSITATQAANGYTVSVYFTATKLGIHTAYITINGGDALESKKITLKGSCVKNAGPTNEVMGRFDNGLVTNSINSFVVTGGNGNGNGTSVMAPNSSLTDDELAFDGSIYVEGQNTTESPMVQNIATGLSELARDVKIYAEGQDIVIETPVEQSAIVSDIAGHARRVNLQAGRNVIPAGGNGVHIVRVGDKSAKLMLR